MSRRRMSYAERKKKSLKSKGGKERGINKEN